MGSAASPSQPDPVNRRQSDPRELGADLQRGVQAVGEFRVIAFQWRVEIEHRRGFLLRDAADRGANHVREGLEIELRERRTIGRVGGVLAVLVGGYHGALLALMPAQPLWNTGPTILVSVFAFVTTGIAGVLLVRMLLGSADEKSALLAELRPVRWCLGVALALQILASFVWWLQLSYGPEGAQQALAAANAAHGPMFWGLGVGLGLVLPVALGFWLLRQEKAESGRASAGLVTLICLLVLIGAFFFRLGIVLGGQVPVPTATLS